MIEARFKHVHRLMVFPLMMVMAIGSGCMEHKVGNRTAQEVFPRTVDAELVSASCAGDREGVAKALIQGASANARGEQGITPLAWAISCTNRVGVEVLLQAGADPNASVGKGDSTLVEVAATYDDTEMLRLLLRHGGVSDHANAAGRTPLDTALTKGIHEQKWDNWYALLDAGFDINKVYNGSTIAENAAMLNQHDKVLELIERGYNHNLNMLARFVAQGPVDFPDAIADRNRLIAKLKSLGVPYDKINAEYQREQEEADRPRVEVTVVVPLA